MGKYYKAEDVISFLNMNCPKDMWEYQIADLPTIEVSEDAISREDAVNALIAHFIPQTYMGEEVEQASKLARKIMANAECVIPSRAGGEWEWHGSPFKDDGAVNMIVCSLCGHAPVWDSAEGKPNYCPNCGAKMKGVEK